MRTESQIFETVRRKYPDTSKYLTDRMVLADTKPYPAGHIHVVKFGRAAGSLKTVFAIEQGKSDSLQILDDAESLVEAMSLAYTNVRTPGWSSRLDPIEGTAAAIAIMLTATIIFVILYGVTHLDGKLDVPPVLSNALTTVIGFYFGRAGAKAVGPRPAGAPPS